MNAAPPRKGSFLRTVQAVAWSLIGLRQHSAYQQDIEKLHPLHIVLVGLVALLRFVAGLSALVKWIV